MNQTLKVSTPTDTEIVMTRDFDAPRGLVYLGDFLGGDYAFFLKLRTI